MYAMESNPEEYGGIIAMDLQTSEQSQMWLRLGM